MPTLYNNGLAGSVAVTNLDRARQSNIGTWLISKYVIQNEMALSDCIVMFGSGTISDMDIQAWEVGIMGGAIDAHPAVPIMTSEGPPAVYSRRNLKFDVGYSLDGSIYDTPGTTTSGRLWESGIDDIGFDAIGTLHRNKTLQCMNNCGLELPLCLRVAALPMAGYQNTWIGKTVVMRVYVASNVRPV